MPASLTKIAPAKVNLFLHIIGKTEDNYHALQSLKTFTDFGDKITIEHAPEYKLIIDGPFAVPADESNLVTQAIKALSKALNKSSNICIHLTKNIPSGAGLGGGSSDAATAIKALLDFWQTDLLQDTLDQILMSLGSDVPACYLSQLCFAQGRGTSLTTIPSPPELAAVLTYPNQKNDTTVIFKKYNQNFSTPIKPPPSFKDADHLIEFIANKKNDLENAAIQHTPIIQDVLECLDHENECLISRMSGSGSACFGLFQTIENAQKAADNIRQNKPDWWVQACLLK